MDDEDTGKIWRTLMLRGYANILSTSDRGDCPQSDGEHVFSTAISFVGVLAYQIAIKTRLFSVVFGSLNCGKAW
jgi:hypothetical protein